jgi:hypothetical protein
VNRDKYRDKICEINENPALSQIEKNEALAELYDELIPGEEPKPEKGHHWQGMFKPAKHESCKILTWNGTVGFLQIEVVSPEDRRNELLIKNSRILGICGETSNELLFVYSHLEAKRDVIDRLKELNGGLDTSIKTNHYEPRLNSDMTITIIQLMTFQFLPDWFHAATDTIWSQIISEFGEEKIRLAIWPKYEEKYDS